MMISRIKLIIKLLLILFLLFVVGLFTLVVIINNIPYKPQIIAVVDRHTNYNIKIKGKAKYSLLPTISMQAHDIIVRPKNTSQPLLAAKELYLSINPVKYLLAKIKGSKENNVLLKLDSVVLAGLNTAINVNSKVNISFFPELNINGSIELVPSDYKNNTVISPLKININLTSKEQSFSIDQQQVAAELINKLLTPNPLISGTSDIKAKLLIANNQANSNILNNISGNLNIIVNNGKLHGLDIFNILVHSEQQLHSLFDLMRGNVKQSIPSLLAKKQNMPAEIGEQFFSIFTKLVLEANFHNGITNDSKISLQHPTYTVQGSGMIDLAKKLIDYKVNANLTKIDPEDPTQVAQYIKSTPVFIKIQGSLNNPNFIINTQEYLNSGLQELQKSLITNILNIGKAIKK